MSFHRRPVACWARSAIIKWSRTVQSGKTSVRLVSPANAEPGPSVGRQVAQAASPKDDLAGVLIDLPAHTVEQGGLAGSVGTDQPDTLTGTNTKCYVVHCHDSAE